MINKIEKKFHYFILYLLLARLYNVIRIQRSSSILIEIHVLKLIPY